MSKTLKLYPIVPFKLYQSAKTHDLTTGQRVDLVDRYKITMVVNLWHTVDIDMKRYVKRYVHMSLPDGKTPIFDEMEALADSVTMYMRQGEVVLSHCYGGRNRSGLLDAIICMRWFGMDGATAYEYIRRCRPNSLVNETFANWLKRQTGV